MASNSKTSVVSALRQPPKPAIMASNSKTSVVSVLRPPQSIVISRSFARMSVTYQRRHMRKDFYCFLTSVYTAEVLIGALLLAAGGYFFIISDEKCSGAGGDRSVYWLLPLVSILSFATTVGNFGYNCWAFFHRSRFIWIACSVLCTCCIVLIVLMVAVVTASLCRDIHHSNAEIISSVGAILVFISGIHLVLVYHPNSKFARTNRCGGARHYRATPYIHNTQTFD